MENPPRVQQVPITNAELEWFTEIGRQIRPILRAIPSSSFLRDHLNPSILEIARQGQRLMEILPIPENLSDIRHVLADVREMWPRIEWSQVNSEQMNRMAGSIQHLGHLAEKLQEFERQRQEEDERSKTMAHLALLNRIRAPEVEGTMSGETREVIAKDVQAIIEPLAREFKSLAAQVKRLPKKEDKLTKPHPDFELSGTVLQLFPGKGNPRFTLKRGNKMAERTLQQAEYDVLLCLGKEMRLSKRRSTLSFSERGWVGQDKILGLLVERSSSKGNAAGYLTTIIQRLREKIESAAKDLGTTVNRLRVIENGAPARGQKRSLYRLSVPPDQIILPRQ